MDIFYREKAFHAGKKSGVMTLPPQENMPVTPLILMPLLSFSDNLPYDNHIIFQQNVNNFEIALKTCSILVWGAVPLNY